MEMQRRFDKTAMSERTDRFIKLVGLTIRNHYPSGSPAGSSASAWQGPGTIP
jgi:hypothetical protein